MCLTTMRLGYKDMIGCLKWSSTLDPRVDILSLLNLKRPSIHPSWDGVATEPCVSLPPCISSHLAMIDCYHLVNKLEIQHLCLYLTIYDVMHQIYFFCTHIIAYINSWGIVQLFHHTKYWFYLISPLKLL